MMKIEEIYGKLDQLFAENKITEVEPFLLECLEKAREEFDFIVVDSSPMALVADAEAISKYTDASALVVRQDFVMTKDINDTIDVLRMQKASFIGCVLNGVRQSGVMGKSKQDYSHTSRHHSTRNSLKER